MSFCLCEIPRAVKFIKTESTTMINRDAGRVRGELVFLSYREIRDDEKVLEMESDAHAA